MPGDSGSLVVNATTGDIYGHIVSGDPMSRLAYIIPAYKIFNDIEKQFGARPSFPIPSKQKTSKSHKHGDKSTNKVRNTPSSKTTEAKRVSFSQKSGDVDNWTEISKEIVTEDAIKYEGYHYRETKDFYYVTGQLQYVSSSSEVPIN